MRTLEKCVKHVQILQAPQRRQWRRFGFSIVNFEHVSKPFSGVCFKFLVFDFEQVNGSGGTTLYYFIVYFRQM